MPTLLRTILALILGIIVGGAVNMALIVLGPSLIAPPPGADMSTAEGLKAAMPLLTAKHFIFPFLAHALGTLAGALTGALTGALIASTHRTIVAYAIGGVYLCGGIAASFMIPAPIWFIALDLAAAYIPMAWLGLTIADRIKPAAAR